MGEENCQFARELRRGRRLEFVSGPLLRSSFLGYPTEPTEVLSDCRGHTDRFQNGAIYSYPRSPVSRIGAPETTVSRTWPRRIWLLRDQTQFIPVTGQFSRALVGRSDSGT